MVREVVFRPQAEDEVIEVRAFKRFPYAVYFRLTSDAIVVLAVHGRQDPERWRGR